MTADNIETRTFTADGRIYTCAEPTQWSAPDRAQVTGFDYWTTRGDSGLRYGPVRSAISLTPTAIFRAGMAAWNGRPGWALRPTMTASTPPGPASARPAARPFPRSSPRLDRGRRVDGGRSNQHAPKTPELVMIRTDRGEPGEWPCCRDRPPGAARPNPLGAR